MLPWQLGQLLAAVPVRRTVDALRSTCPNLVASFDSRGIPAAEVASALIACLPAAFALRFDEIRSCAQRSSGQQSVELHALLELLGADGSIHEVCVAARITLQPPGEPAAWRNETPIGLASMQLALGTGPAGSWQSFACFHEVQTQVRMG